MLNIVNTILIRSMEMYYVAKRSRKKQLMDFDLTLLTVILISNSVRSVSLSAPCIHRFPMTKSHVVTHILQTRTKTNLLAFNLTLPVYCQYKYQPSPSHTMNRLFIMYDKSNINSNQKYLYKQYTGQTISSQVNNPK